MSFVSERKKIYEKGLNEIFTEKDALKIISEENLSDVYRVIELSQLTPDFLKENELVFWHDPQNNEWCNGFTSERRSVTNSEIQHSNDYIEALKKLIFRARIQKKSLEYEKEQLKKQYGLE